MSLIPYALVGLLPSGLFYIWVERNMAIPWLSFALNWPWFRSTDWPLALVLLWNTLLFSIFAVTHSWLARPHNMERTAQRLALGTRRSAHRRFYITIAGLSLLILMGFWQPTGIILWSLNLEWWTLQALSVGLFWALLGAGAWVMRAHGVGEFLGTKEASTSEKAPRLLVTGVYRYIRHPLYAANLLAFTLAPTMSLDRAWITVCLALYLVVSIPLEEQKLIEELGEGYRRYRLEVPALIPRLRGRGRTRAS